LPPTATPITPQQKRALIAACLGWMLDAMDVLLYSLVLGAVQKDLGLSSSTSGLLVSLTLITASFGGILFGRLADRWGRAKAMMASILVYSVFTGLCGLAQNVWQLAACRLLLGLGMGGEWATGATLVAETWPEEHRGKALGLMQSFWAIGYALAVAVNWLVLPRWGWRAVFFVGLLPALVTLWMRRGVEEPQLWKERKAPEPFSAIFHGKLLRNTILASAINSFGLFAWWALFTWIPSFLALPVAQGGRGLNIGQSSGWMLLMQAGAWVGYVSFGYIADKFGGKRTYVVYLFFSGVLAYLYGQVTDPQTLMLLSPLLGFFCTGCFSGFAIVASAMFPTRLRGTGLGFTYNLGRIASALGPYAVGKLSETQGLSVAFLLTSVSYVAAALITTAVEEKKTLE
jgi:MFS family permease